MRFGRCVAVVIALQLFGGATAYAAGNVVKLIYDAAGNISQIQRQAAPGFGITSFSPGNGPVGTAVTVYGAGFSATPINNIVTFNGTAAVVSASDSGSISTTVPSGATTGRITVTVNGVMATAATDFVVTVVGAPTISTVTPTIGAAGASVAVSGSNFAVGATTVTLNGVTAATSASSTSDLGFTVPPAAASGKIKATTSVGTGTSAMDFIVPPPGMQAADIVASTRVAPGGGSGNVAVGAAGKSALVLFDGTANTYYSLHLSTYETSPTTATVAYKVIGPDNSVLMSGSIGGPNRLSIHLPKALVNGTYSVLLSPGAATLNTDVRVQINPVLTVDGPSASTALNFAFQSARFVFDATASQRIGIGLLAVAFTPSTLANPSAGVAIYRPDGVEVSPAISCFGANTNNPQGNCEGGLLAPIAGTYSLLVQSPQAAYVTATVQLNSEVTGVLSADVSSDVSLARVGQDARHSFVAAAGDSLGLDISGLNQLPTSQPISGNIYKPDGSYLGGCNIAATGSYCELGVLSTAGSYSVSLSPTFGAYGSMKATLKQGPLLSTTASPASFAPAYVPESARFRFAAAVGQTVNIGLTDIAYVGSSGAATSVSLFNSSASRVGNAFTCTPSLNGGTCRGRFPALSSAGTYSVVVTPPPGVKVSGHVSLSDDISGVLSDGVAQAINALRPGQAARLMFTGTAGDNTAVKVFGVSTSVSAQTLSFMILGPNGALLGNGSASGSSAGIVNLFSLPSTGSYSVVIEPLSGITWQGQFALDSGAAVSINGSPTSPTSAAGEPLRYKFAATAGQRVEFGMTGLGYATAGTGATTMTLFGPTGQSLATSSCNTSGVGACEAFIASAPTTGSYVMVLLPPNSSSIAAGAFAISTPVVGTLAVGDPVQNVAITRSGQTARYTFSGTAAQALRLNWTSAIVSSGATVAVSILKPDGNALDSASFLTGASGGRDLPALPLSGTYTVIFDPSLSATMSASISLATR